MAPIRQMAKVGRRPKMLAQMAEHVDAEEGTDVENQRSNTRPFLQGSVECRTAESFSFKHRLEDFSLQVGGEESDTPQANHSGTCQQQSDESSITQFGVSEEFAVGTQLFLDAVGSRCRLPSFRLFQATANDQRKQGWSSADQEHRLPGCSGHSDQRCRDIANRRKLPAIARVHAGELGRA